MLAIQDLFTLYYCDQFIHSSSTDGSRIDRPAFVVCSLSILVLCCVFSISFIFNQILSHGPNVVVLQVTGADKILRGMYKIFDQSPSRKADYERLTDGLLMYGITLTPLLTFGWSC